MSLKISLFQTHLKFLTTPSPRVSWWPLYNICQGCDSNEACNQSLGFFGVRTPTENWVTLSSQGAFSSLKQWVKQMALNQHSFGRVLFWQKRVTHPSGELSGSREQGIHIPGQLSGRNRMVLCCEWLPKSSLTLSKRLYLQSSARGGLQWSDIDWLHPHSTAVVLSLITASVRCSYDLWSTMMQCLLSVYIF